jgi:hypothetical protein
MLSQFRPSYASFGHIRSRLVRLGHFKSGEVRLCLLDQDRRE